MKEQRAREQADQARMIGSCLLLLLESPPEPGIDAFVASIPQGQQNPMPAKEILRINPNTNGCGIVDLKSLRSELGRILSCSALDSQKRMVRGFRKHDSHLIIGRRFCEENSDRTCKNENGSAESPRDRLIRLQLWECPEPESEVYDGVITENPPRFLKSEGFVVRTEAIPASLG